MQALTNSKSKKATHELLSEGIIRLSLNPNTEIEPDDLREMHRHHLKLTEGKSFGILLITTSFAIPSAASRALLATKEFTSTHKASAYIVKSTAAKIMGNFFIRFNKPITPTRLFSNEEVGLEWLKNEMKKWY